MPLKSGLAEYDNVGDIFNTFTRDSIRKLEGKILSCRVLEIDETGEGTNGVLVAEILDDIKLKGNNIIPEVYPLDPNSKNYPLVNETVVVVALANKDFQNNYNRLTFYYLNTINLWNNQQANPIPSPQQNILPNTQNKGYIQVESTNNPNKPSQGSNTVFSPGYYFNSDIIANPTYPYEGDYIIDGRFGNSIRFGNTVPNGTTFVNNNWSSGSQTILGNPITILTNQKHTQQPSYNSITEDINLDGSSIYLTSTQKIPLEASSTSYSSYSSNPPIKPNEYSGKQLILNSGRLVFNSTEDHILLSSIKTVNINAINGFNVDSPQSVIQSNSVLLGGAQATEPVLKGDTTINILVDLVNQLQALTIALQTVTPTGGPAVAAAAAQLAPQLAVIRTQLQTTTKSQVSKTL
jgi:hypothetical protein